MVIQKYYFVVPQYLTTFIPLFLNLLPLKKADFMSVRLSVSKLIALWAFSESALGGLLHAINMPFSGLLLGGIAVTVICCIGFTAERPGSAILYGTLVAISVKFALSPHSPATSYIAVGFQGVVGALMFTFQRRSLPVYIFYGGIALVESALQKVITLTIIYGNALWESLNVVAQQMAKSLHLDSSLSYAVVLLLIYTALYFAWGCLIGYWAYKIPIEINTIDKSQIIGIDITEKDFVKKKRKFKFLLWLPLVLILFASLLLLRQSGLSVLQLILRPFIVIMAWWFVLNPFLKALLARFLNGRSNNMARIIDGIRQDIPKLRKLSFQTADYVTRHYRGVSRVRRFISILIILAGEENSNLTE